MNKTLRNLALVALAAAPFSAFAEITGAGTAADPYKIGSAEDLCNAYLKVQENIAGMTYFVQTADIDMAGVNDYHAINGFSGVYTSAINYDGNNHVIKNFGPKLEAADAAKANYYMTSVFGVLTGTVKNLGIVDAKIVNNNGQGGGFLAAYAGHSSAASIAPKTVIENVYATGTIDAVGNTNYFGGLFGTTGSDVEITNCFVNAEIKGSAKVGGIVGRQRNTVTLNNVYVAGTITGDAPVALVAASDKTPSLVANNVVAFNSGVDNAVVGSAVTGTVQVATAANKDELIKLVKSWSGFSATEEINGYPALNYALSGAGTAENPYIIATAEDLCNAYRFVNTAEAKEVYFVQTADIDMDGIEEYHAINGYNGAYAASINYDGQNHLIKNFAPNDYSGNTAETNFYYNATIFGVATGTIKNLGVVDAYVGANDGHGVGILGGYLGHAAAVNCKNTTIENVFVTGTVAASNYYAGGMFGAMGPGEGMTASIVNCFANVEVSSEAANRQVGAIVGRTDNYLALENVYAAGKIKPAAGSTAAGLIAGTGAGSVDALNVIAFNTGADKATGVNNAGEAITIATDANKAELIATVQGWDAFSADKLVNGYPALAAFDYGETSGIFDIAVDEVEANGPAVYYNLQGVQVANPENGVYIVRRGNKVTKELIRK